MVLREPWHGHNYSERVWIHKDRFIQAVGQTIEDGIISGHSVSRMTDKLIDYVKDTAPGGIRTSAETLVRSETAHFMNQGQRMAYEEIGIKQYRFVAALSELTRDRCGSLDGGVLDTDKAVEGENFPPIHPRCRCVTIMADVNLTSRIARDPLTSENYKVNGSMTFDEWKNSLSDEQKNALKYVANAEKRGIINTGSISGALNPYSKRAEGHAVRYYESVRYMTTDVARIASNTGYSTNEIQRIKNFIFMEKHDLGRGKLEDFDASYEMAQSWQRLIDGKNIQQHDLILLKHEIMENKLVDLGIPQSEAHIMTSKEYNYSREARKYYDTIEKHKKR